jgi:hypothetical protein
MAQKNPHNPWKDLWNVSLLPTVAAVPSAGPPPGPGPGPATGRALQRPALLSVSEDTTADLQHAA